MGEPKKSSHERSCISLLDQTTVDLIDMKNHLTLLYDKSCKISERLNVLDFLQSDLQAEIVLLRNKTISMLQSLDENRTT